MWVQRFSPSRLFEGPIPKLPSCSRGSTSANPLSIVHFQLSILLNPFPNALLDAARLRGDALADAFLARVMGDAASKAAFYAALGGGGAGLWRWVEAHGPELTASIGPLPAGAKTYWAGEARRIFEKRGGEILLLLGLYSLPYCYAAAKGAAVLAATGRLSGKAQALVRLQETAGFVHTALSAPEPEVRQACLQVRLIHGLVRYHLRAKGWDEAEYGLPVNQEDMAGTNLAFGFLTVRGLRKLGLPLSPAETEAYLGWFSILGTWLGVEPALAPAAQAACLTLTQAIERRHHAASAQGRELTQALLESFGAAQAPEGLVSRAPMLMAALLGQDIAALLGLPVAEPGYLDNLKTVNMLRTFAPVEPDWLNLRRTRREVRRTRLRHEN